jgi:hypothetical protein
MHSVTTPLPKAFAIVRAYWSKGMSGRKRAVSSDAYSEVNSTELSNFGIREIDKKIEMVLIADKGGTYSFHSFPISSLVRRIEFHTEEWCDLDGVQHISRIWNITLRADRHSGVSAGDTCFIGYYSDLGSIGPVAVFTDQVLYKSCNRHKKTRGPFVSAQNFRDESDLIRWIKEQKNDFYQQTPVLVARCFKPRKLISSIVVGSRYPRFAYGLLPKEIPLEMLINHISRCEKASDAFALLKDAILGGMSSSGPAFIEGCPSKNSVFDGIFEALVCVTLAGPVLGIEDWYGKPVSEYFIEITGKLTRAISSGETLNLLKEDGNKGFSPVLVDESLSSVRRTLAGKERLMALKIKSHLLNLLAGELHEKGVRRLRDLREGEGGTR